MNEVLVLALIGIVVAGFVLWPLLRRRPAPAPRASTRQTAAAAARTGPPISEELAELELDRAMGRISEADYTRWRSEMEAGVIESDEPASPDEGSVTTDVTARAEALVRKWRAVPRPTCPNCGERPEAEARYCSSCGASLTT